MRGVRPGEAANRPVCARPPGRPGAPGKLLAGPARLLQRTAPWKVTHRRLQPQLSARKRARRRAYVVSEWNYHDCAKYTLTWAR